MKLKENGFTLLEVLISVSIIAIVFTAFIRLNIFSLKSVEKSIKLSQLLFLTKQKMSEIEHESYPELGLKNGSFDKHLDYKWIEKVSEFGISGVRRIELSVSAPDGETNDVLFYKSE